VKDDRLYLIHIRECLSRIAHYTAAGKEGFFADAKRKMLCFETYKRWPNPHCVCHGNCAPDFRKSIGVPSEAFVMSPSTTIWAST
jgi:hypothetical protein